MTTITVVIHISTPGGKVEKLSTKIRLWKCGKLPIVQNLSVLLWKTKNPLNSHTK